MYDEHTAGVELADHSHMGKLCIHFDLFVSTSRVFVNVTWPRTAAKEQRNADARRTYCVRSVDVPGLNRNLLTHRTPVQKIGSGTW